jgi:hypothetical protein
VEALSNITLNLVSTLIIAGAGRLRDEALGEEQERDLKDVFQRATAAMLVELARTDIGNQQMLERYEREFGGFFGDPWVAETLVGVALDSKDLPVDRLRARFSEMGFDPDALPISFGRALGVFVLELTERLDEEASRGGPLEALVNRSDLKAIRRSVEDLARESGSTSPDVDELERASRARCADRWYAAGLAEEKAFTLADNPTVGAPGPRLRDALRRPVAILVGELGAGKSLTLERLFQRAVVRLREEPAAPLPTFMQAWEVDGPLEDVVVHKTSALGNPRRRGAAIFVDGAEEAGRGHAARLLTEARVLAHTWPQTTVVIASRPISELDAKDEKVTMPELTVEETKTLIEAISGRELGAAETRRWPRSIKEAVKRPLFATLVGLYLRKGGFGARRQSPRSTGEMLSDLVDRAFERAGEEVELEQLRRLAVASIDRGGGPVRATDVMTTSEARRLRETGLVVERNAAVGFPLQILNEWFAAQALEAGLVDPNDLASDPARLERWLYPLAIAVGTFGYSRLKELLGPVVRQAPAFASQVVAEGLAKPRASSETPPQPTPDECVTQIRDTMISWAGAIGPLAPLIAPVHEDGSLSTLGVSTFRGRVTSMSWYRGEEDLGDVVRLSDHLPQMLPTLEWPSIVPVNPGHQPAWAWRWTRDELVKALSRLLKERRLPINNGGLLAREAAWDAACELVRRFGAKRRRPRRGPIPLDELEHYLTDVLAQDEGAIAFSDQPGRRGRIYELRYLRDEIRRLREAGETELWPPWPTENLTFDDPKIKQLREAEDTSVYTWDLYSTETVCERARVILEGALEGYSRFVEDLFPQLAPRLREAVLLPARLTGVLVTDSPSPYWRRQPSVDWYLDPLPPGNPNEVDLRVGGHGYYGFEQEDMLAVLDRQRMRRPQAAEWLSYPHHVLHYSLFREDAATETAYELLWSDLKRVSWVDGRFNRKF